MGCLKLTYYPELEPQKNTFGEELTTKISSKSLCSSYLFGFNGKEKDDEWNGQTGSTYDFGARLYDARIGRWMAIDPKAAQMPFISPYSFSYNCPTIFQDPDGEKPRVTVSKSEDGSHVTITITNKVYLVSKTDDVAYPNNIKVNTNLQGGSYEVEGITYTVNIQNEIVNVRSVSQAKRAILNDNMVGVIVLMGNKGRSFYTPSKSAFDYIRLNTKEDDFENTLAHEIGHDIGFADKYIDVLGFSRVFLYFTNTLMGDMSKLSDYEIQLIGSDVMKLVKGEGGVKNGETIYLNNGKGTTPVDKEEDALPFGQIIPAVLYGFDYRNAIPRMYIRTNSPSLGTATGREVKNKKSQSKPMFY